MRVGYLCGLDSGISLSLKDADGSWEHKRSEMSSPTIYTSIWAVFGCQYLHKYTWYASGCETEYVWGTCVDLIPAYLHHWRTLAEVESIKAVTCRVLLYNCEFQRFLGAYVYTSTHMMHDGSGCETEYVWGTCVDFIPACLYHFITLAQGESIRVVQNCSLLS